jgi:hypothetical protein
LVMLRRKRLRPWLPTYATVATKRPGNSRCTDTEYWWMRSGILYSSAYARGWYSRLFGLLMKFARVAAMSSG